ncbi:hypothetical protein THAOC_34244, partial [Thalassiosira oceanica]
MGGGKSTWEPTSSSTSTATPCCSADILRITLARLKQAAWTGTPQIQRVFEAMNPLLAYALAPMHL